jgi:enediyne polyketide synthase
MNAIAIVGMACVYPDARSPGELWENVLAQRRAFRRVPPERLRLEDFFSADPQAPDSTYATEAAVIEGYEFDRVAFRVVGSTFRAADLAHWLALDVAARALADAGFTDGNGLPRETTGVLLGNTLTGEFSRANTLRLRWPYVRRVLDAALAKENWTPEQRQKFLSNLETEYKSPFPPVGEETLAGSLSNTIAGRICNQFDLKGGGYTVDGACASSLLATANACSALAAGDLDVAIAGGVDLSLDPFELVGFAKTGALAPDEMRVFDRRSAGFWPGEGCGMVVLMRHDDALAQGRRVYAVIRGWGISSDGSGGITRPESDGQIEALRRAYRRAGFGIETVSYCEGHGTGTAVGDATELEALSRARRETKINSPPAAIGSIKANIGHTKAAAGVAGLIKATMAVHMQVLPPMTGCEQPHPQLAGPAPALRVLREAEPWPQDRPLRASVSAMGFGGINAHIVLESVVTERRETFSTRERSLSRSSQDAELFLLAAETGEQLAPQVEKIFVLAARLSRAELTDLAAQLEKNPGRGPVRAAIVASKPAELAERLQTLKSWLQNSVPSRMDFSEGVFLGSGGSAPRIAFLFPGQGSPTHLDGGVWRRRFESVRELYSRAELPADGDTVSTRVMQPAVVTASLAGLKVLEEFGIVADAAIGHSLGEITALHWAGAFDEETLLRIVRVRGAAMAELGSPSGAMLALAAPWQEVQKMLNGGPLAIVGYNSPQQTVVAGAADAIKNLTRRAAARGWRTSELPVSHAFHTPFVAAAVPVLAGQLAREKIAGPRRPVFSTVTGSRVAGGEDLRELLCRQVTSPVRFSSAFAALRGAVDLLIEVGPGAVLSSLVHETADIPVVALDAGGNSLGGLLQALGAAFVLGAPVKHAALFADRFVRPFALDWKPKFFANPCERAPVSEASERPAPARRENENESQNGGTVPGAPIQPYDLIRQLVADRAELPVAAIRDESRMLSDLHLNSITVGQLVSEAARRLGLARIVGLLDFANVSVAELAGAMEELKRTGAPMHADDKRRQPPGVDIWIHSFAVELVEAKRGRRRNTTVANSSPPGQLDDGRNLKSEPHGNAAARDSRAPDGWRVFSPKDLPLAVSLREKLARTGGDGVVLCLPENPTEEIIGLLLDSARAVMAVKREPRFVLVQHGWGGAGFARTLHLETPGLTTCVVNVPQSHPQAVDWIIAEALSASGYSEAHYDTDGCRREPRLKLVSFVGEETGKFPIGPDDVLLVTGGGKGIAAESALALARATGVRLALLGRSDPETDKELVENLARMTAAGVRCCYTRADVTDAESVRQAVATIGKTLGPVTAFLHGAGTNTPQLIGALDEAAFRRTVAPKIQGAGNVLAAIDPARLRLFITFGSIIARTGLRGEADYATANEWMTAFTEEFQAAHPQCRCLALEWSVWSGVGMGERLGRMEALIAQGIMPIPPDEGVRILLESVRRPQSGVALVVAGRFGEPPALKLDAPELPLRRFLDRKRVYYPGVELIVEAELSVEADPYLRDHALQKQKLFPAVFGLEAMAQAAMALAGATAPPVFEQVEWSRPVTVSDKTPTTIRVAALRRAADLVEVCLRSEETDFHVDHFRALCRFGAGAEGGAARVAWSQPGTSRVELEPQQDLYDRMLFHEGRFRRVRSYRLLKARECLAEITPDSDASWYGPYLPAEFVLGDPGARDAALHAIQACIPHQRILPTGVEQVVIHRAGPGTRFARAKERKRDGSNFIYDLEVTDANGEVIECWSGLHLRAVAELPARGAWPEALLAPYLERRLEELVESAPVSVAFERHAGSDALMQQALVRPEKIWRRPDGKPVIVGDEGVSAAHAREFTLAVAGEAGAACDLEAVVPRSDGVWRELLGEERFKLAEQISREESGGLDTAATRLWAATECLKKAGLPAGAPLTLESGTADGWVLLRSGTLAIATCAVAAAKVKTVLVAAVAVRSAAASHPRRARAEAAAGRENLRAK